MKKFNPVRKVKGFATTQSVRLSEKTIHKTAMANNFLTDIADVFLFIVRIILETFSRNFEFKEFFRQCFQIGYKSLPLISITGTIMGLVLTIQSRPVLVDFGAVTLLPGMVAISLIREMGPVITALICAGKIGSGMGAELGSMKVTEQIDAMEVSSTNPMRFLVVTRVLAATLMIPLLILYADALGILGSWVGANIKGDVSLNEKPVVEIKNLRKSFGKQEVLTDVTLNLFEGENLVVLGKSGSGKSVLIKCVVRLLTADAGTINVFEKDVTSLDRKELGGLRQKIGFLFQSGALYDSMTVKQNLEFPLRRIRKDLSGKEIDLKINDVLENVGLVDALNKMPSQLSGGMRKRISLARTIVVDPMIMLYDEPTTGLDPVTSDEISSLIIDVQKKYKTSSIIITHDIKCARNTANRMIMLSDGEVYLEGKPSDFENSADPLIRSFFI